MSGILYIVATPIGNLEDITFRAIKTLKEVDIVLAEDTRVTMKLLNFIDDLNSQFSITNLQRHHTQSTIRNTLSKSSVLSYHQHSSEERKLEILKMLMDGQNIALVTDAGTPGISDPGNELVSFLLENLPDLQVVPIPGPSAITSALSVSGFDSSKFLFLGFWPKKKTKKTLKMIKRVKVNFVYYDSPFRVIRNLGTIEKELGSDTKVVIGRELTKLHETIYRGNVSEVKSQLEKEERVRGELVVVANLSN